MRVLCSIATYGWLFALPTTTSFSTPLAVSSIEAVQPTRPAWSSFNRPIVPLSVATTTSSDALTDDDQGATLSSLILNLVKGIVGAGVLTLPSGIAKMGNTPSTLLPALFLIVIIGTLSGYGFSLIGRVCHLTDTNSYRRAWEESVSKESSWIPAVSVTLKTIFAILACTYEYCRPEQACVGVQHLTHYTFCKTDSMILGDTFQSIALSAGLELSKTTTLVGLTSFVLLPLCLLKNLSSLAPFSLLGSLGMFYTAVAMTIRYVSKVYCAGGKFHAGSSELAPSFGTTSGTLWSPSTAILLGMLSTACTYRFRFCIRVL